MSEKKRIIAIDGGGIKGVFSTSLLATLEDSIGDNIANYFDLIVGTSTGGIIALALGLGLPATEILAFYEKFGPRIFASNHRSGWFRSKYKSAPLKEALDTCFDEKKLGDSKKRLVIPSLNLENGEVYIYKTAHHPRLQRDYKVEAVEVGLATSAAPTYFPTHRAATGTPLIDGGLWANNPVGVAVVEAITVLDWPRDSLKVLSLGCTKPLNVNWGRKIPLGKLYWGFKLPDVFMQAQSYGSLGIAKLVAGHDNIIRIAPSVSHRRFSLGNAKEIQSLKGLGHSEARDALAQLRETFLSNPVEPFIPFNQL